MNHNFSSTTFWRVSKINNAIFQKTERSVINTMRASLLETLIPLKINRLCTIILGRKENKSILVSTYKKAVFFQYMVWMLMIPIKYKYQHQKPQKQ